MENPIKMDDLGVPLFLETSISPDGQPLRTPNASQPKPRFRSDGIGSNDVSGESSLSCPSHPPVLKKRPVISGQFAPTTGGYIHSGINSPSWLENEPGLNEDAFPI